MHVCRLIAGTFLCSWWPYFDFFLANISIFNLVNIAVDRWLPDTCSVVTHHV